AGPREREGADAVGERGLDRGDAGAHHAAGGGAAQLLDLDRDLAGERERGPGGVELAVGVGLAGEDAVDEGVRAAAVLLDGDLVLVGRGQAVGPRVNGELGRGGRI